MVWSKQRDIAAWSILIVGMLVTLWIWNVVQVGTFDDARTRFDSRAEQIKTAVAERMVAYEQILLGGVGLFESSPGPVTRSMWRTYVENLRIDKNYPGIQGVGFSLQINPEEKDDHVRRTREEGFPDYRVRPDGERDIYTSIIYLEPFSGRNLRAFGYDMFSEGVRRAAMERARDSGKVSISGKVILVQETGKDVQNGFLIYASVYRKGMPTQTIEQRRAALLGYAYSPFRVNDFLQGIFHARTTDIDFEIYDGDGLDEQRLIYDSDGVKAGEWKTLAGSEAPLFKATKTIAFQDQKWTLHFRSLPEFEAMIDRQKSNVILALGAIFSVLCFVVVHSAFTTRRKSVQLAEEAISALSTSENRLKSLLDNTPAVVYMKQVDGRYILINKQWATLFKTTNEAMKEKLDSDFFPKDIADAFMANDKRVVESGEPLIVEEVAPHDDGLHTYISVKFPLRDGVGNIYGMAGISTDITERKRTEAELQQHREHLEELVELRTYQLTMENLDRQRAEESLARTLREQNTIFSTNPDIIYVADLQACLVKWNKSLETVTGYSPEEIVGKKCISFFSPQEADLVASAIARVMSEGKGEVEAHLLCKSGALIPYHFNGVPLRNENGGIIGFTGTGRDITERRQAEERVKKIYEQLIHSEKLSALGKLTGSIAHEFNNPIYGLRNIIEQTREEEGLDEEITGLLDLAVRECDRMAGLVRKLQGFYKPSDDTRAIVDIHQLLDDIEALTRKKLQVKGIVLIKNYSPNLPEVDVVEDQIKQVLLNLINNAEEAISGENGKIAITTEVNGANIEVHIKDTGEGIPEENLRLIFEPFFSTKGIKGTGLGLSVCYGIINAHGGTIEVTSKRGEGSTFTLRLPIQREA